MQSGFSCNILIYNFYFVYWAPLILDIVEEGEEDVEKGEDDEDDDSQTIVN